MINRFLKAKHWQLFLLLFGIPFLFQFALFSSMFVNSIENPEPDPIVIFKPFSYFPIVMILFCGVFFGWFWSMSVGLQRKIPKNIKMKVKRFKIFFCIPLLYILLISVFVGSFVGNAANMQEQDIIGIAPFFALIVPLHLFSMFCMFYMLYFTAKTIKTVELQRELRFSDFAGEFFLLWFYFIGIWIIQPKVNKMVADDNLM